MPFINTVVSPTLPSGYINSTKPYKNKSCNIFRIINRSLNWSLESVKKPFGRLNIPLYANSILAGPTSTPRKKNIFVPCRWRTPDVRFAHGGATF